MSAGDETKSEFEKAMSDTRPLEDRDKVAPRPKTLRRRKRRDDEVGGGFEIDRLGERHEGLAPGVDRRTLLKLRNGEFKPDERIDLALHPEVTELRGQEWVPQSPLQYISGLDAGPVIELITEDDQVPVRWVAEDGTTALLNLSTLPVVDDLPAGTEQLSGPSGGGETRTLLPGQGEVWIP